MERRKKWIVILLSFHILLSNCAVARAEALPEFLCASSTVADAVMSYYASVGAGISNLEWINTLNSSLGESFGTVESFINQGYLILNDAGQWTATEAFTTAIENTSAYASLGLNEMFNVSAEEVAAGGGAAVASGGSILAGSMGSLASTGVIPLFAGTTASYWAGIGLGTLASHAIEKYAPWIYSGLPISDQVSIPSGSTVCKFGGNVLYLSPGLYGIVTRGSQYVRGYIGNPLSYSGFFTWGSSQYGVNAKDIANFGLLSSDGSAPVSGNVKIISDDEFSSEQANIRNGVEYRPYSPDVIGSNGNQQANYNSDNEKYTVPDFLPQIDPSREALSPVSMTDWLNFANGANTNTNAGAYPDNGGLFDNMIDAIRGLIPDGGTSPDPGPTPTPTPTPTPVPDPDYGDPNPEQPEFEEQTEEIPDPVGTGSPWILPDLKNKFPFCIPWDIAKIFGKFNSSSRQAPYIHWRFHPNEDIDYTFNLDLEDFEEVAELLRMLELGAFIVGLAFATRYMIGAN